MGYDVAALAFIRLPNAQMGAWKRRKVDATTFHDWPTPLDAGAVPPKTVGQLLKELPKLVGDFTCACRLEDDTVELAAVLPDHVFTINGAQLAAAFRLAAEHGATGRFDYVGYLTSPLAFGFDIRPHETRVHDIGENEARSIERGKIYRWLDASMQGKRSPMPAFPKSWLKRPTFEEARDKVEEQPSTGAAGYDCVVSGSLRFDVKSCKKWLKTDAGPDDLPSLPFGAPPHPRRMPPRDLRFATQQMTEPGVAFRIQAQDGTAWAKGAIVAADLADWGSLLLAVFASASCMGGTGHLWFLSPEGHERRGVVLDVSPGSVAIRDAAAADWDRAAADTDHREAVNRYGGSFS